MKKILVPTDLSPVAAIGLKLAIEIAKRSGASISLVNFTKHPFGQSFTAMGEVNAKVDEEETRFTLEYLHASKARLDALAKEYVSNGVTIETSIEDDELKKGVDHYLQQNNVDLIVMGTSGEESAEEVFTGNHTEQVINISTCPVISVRDGFVIENFDNIVVAVDVLRDNKVSNGLNTLKQVADAFNAHVHLVHVRSASGDSVPMLEGYFKSMAETAGLQHYFVTVLEAEDPAKAIIAFARDVKAGLIAVIKNSKDGIFHVFSNNFSDRLVKEVGRPVFTFNLQNA